ncbi:3-methyl-2-oxobutanoate dehydrogenase subunit VorB [bacterium]|nr:3-methyl-2-oxobutanoate dehydrogenase subunit VorB [candidate division CSSED10-310 bacterium]
MAKELVKGNVAIVKGALLAGCELYFGYPITPASEIAEYASLLFPKLGRTFIQAESEVAAINMVYGASGAGVRCMTASSGPGLSLKQEGISYCAGAELPCLIADIMRGGPGLGNIGPEQSDYDQMVHGGGHGNYKLIVLAPNSGQEMCDFTIKGFELADKWRTPVILLADGYTGQMMEQVDFPSEPVRGQRKDWAVYADQESRENLVTSIYLSHSDLEKHNQRLQEKYARLEKVETLFDEYQVTDADLVLVAYGISSRICRTAVEISRKKNMKVGLLRPQTLFPFPSKRIVELADRGVKCFLSVECSNGQMVKDIRLALNGKTPVEFYGRMGGEVPSAEEIVDHIGSLLGARR